jgi:hypothetical protein
MYTTCIPISNILQYLLEALPIIITILLGKLPIIIVNYCIGRTSLVCGKVVGDDQWDFFQNLGLFSEK